MLAFIKAILVIFGLTALMAMDYNPSETTNYNEYQSSYKYEVNHVN